MKITILTFLIVFAGNIVYSQDLANRVIASGGSHSSSSSYKISYTVGNVVAHKYASQDAVFTSGFQQYWDFSVGIDDMIEDIEIKAYPNPVSDKLYISFGDKRGESCTIKILSLTGIVVFSREYDRSDLSTIEEIDLAELQSGIFLLQIIRQDRTGRIIKLIKE